MPIALASPWRYAHEFTTREGYGASPPVGGFSCTERINLGYESAVGVITREFAERHAHVFRYGTTWTVRLAQSGQVVWSGMLLVPHRRGDEVVLTGEGLGQLAHKTFARLMFQDRDVSHWEFNGPGAELLVGQIVSSDSNYSRSPSIVFHTGPSVGAAAGGALPGHSHALTQEFGGQATYTAYGAELSRLAFAVTIGPVPFEFSVYVTYRDPDHRVPNSELDWQQVFDWASSYSDPLDPLSDVINPPPSEPFVCDIDLHGLDPLVTTRVNSILLIVSGAGPHQTGDFSASFGEVRVNGIVPYQSREGAVIGNAEAFEALFEETWDAESTWFTTNDWPDYYPVEAMIAEMASRIGVFYRAHHDPALLIDALPADFVGLSAADVFNYALTLVGGPYHWRVGGTTETPRLYVGKGNRCAVVDREQPIDLVALDRYDRVQVPFAYPDGSTGYVTAVADIPFQLHPHRDYGDLSMNQPFSEPERGRDFGTRVANALREQRWGGDASLAEVRNHRHQRVAGASLHAGGHVHDPVSGHSGQIETITKQDGYASVQFVSDYPVVDSILARRELSRTRRGAQ